MALHGRWKRPERQLLSSGLALLICCGMAFPSEVLDDCNDVGAWRPLSGRPTPEISRVADGHSGGALRFSFQEGNEASFVGRGVAGDDTWTHSAGLSFWWKGNGDRSFVALTLLDESLTRRHAAILSLRSKEWQRIQLRWEDFVPETLASDWLGRSDAPMQPSDIRGIWFGRWFYLKPWSSCSFEVDDFRLEERIEVVPPELPDGVGLPHTLAKLAAREKVTIAALGDSITSGYRLRKPEREAWPAVLEGLLRKRFDDGKIDVRNFGIGGLETRQAIILLPRDIGVDPPDLAIVHFGYNDLTAMEERRIPQDTRRTIARRNLIELVTRIRRASDGKTEVLLVATVPGGDRARRTALDFIGEEARRVAQELKCGFTDGPRQSFREVLERDGAKALFVTLPDGQQDVSHPHAEGQRIFAEALLKAFETH